MDSNNFKKEMSPKRFGCRYLGIGLLRVLLASVCGFLHFSRYRYGALTYERVQPYDDARG